MLVGVANEGKLSRNTEAVVISKCGVELGEIGRRLRVQRCL